MRGGGGRAGDGGESGEGGWKVLTFGWKNLEEYETESNEKGQWGGGKEVVNWLLWRWERFMFAEWVCVGVG